MDYITILYILLIIFIISAVILLIRISDSDPIEQPSKVITGGEVINPGKIHIVDGLNFIYDRFLTVNVENTDDNILSSYPDLFYVWKAITTLKSEIKDNIIFVIKNQDGYKLSVYDDKLFKKLANTYKIGIVVCYDPEPIKGAHYLKGRDDKTVCDIVDKYKKWGYDTHLISKDTYADKNMFEIIPKFTKLKYGNIPDLEKI